jgi:hypothetical protein
MTPTRAASTARLPRAGAACRVRRGARRRSAAAHASARVVPPSATGFSAPRASAHPLGDARARRNTCASSTRKGGMPSWVTADTAASATPRTADQRLGLSNFPCTPHHHQESHPCRACRVISTRGQTATWPRWASVRAVAVERERTVRCVTKAPTTRARPVVGDAPARSLAAELHPGGVPRVGAGGSRLDCGATGRLAVACRPRAGDVGPVARSQEPRARSVEASASRAASASTPTQEPS